MWQFSGVLGETRCHKPLKAATEKEYVSVCPSEHSGDKPSGKPKRRVDTALVLRAYVQVSDDREDKDSLPE